MIAHMNPSGLDAKTCLSDQPIRFIKNVGFTELEMVLSAYLVIADTGVYGHTREAIQVVQSKGKGCPTVLHVLGELTQQAEDAIRRKDAEGLGQILSQAHLHLKEIGVSSPEADSLVETALSHGASRCQDEWWWTRRLYYRLGSQSGSSARTSKTIRRERSCSDMDRKPVTVRSYANIAIIKYWGKKKEKEMVPATSSISLTLENMYTETTLSPLPTDATADAFYINGQLQSEAEHAKMSKIIDRYRPAGEGFVRIDTQNNMPTAAGLSSSSSGLSALVKACNAYFQLGLDQSQLAQEAKFASGSSSRSFYGPLGAWDKDSGEIYPVETDLKLAMIMLVLEDKKNQFLAVMG